jgi:hypothetical protein
VRVVLVNPPPWRVVEPVYDAPKFPRHGLACLAAALRVHQGFEVSVVDAKLERLGFEGALARILEKEPDVVGFTAFTNEIKPAARLAELVKRARPEATTVIGGVHVTALPCETLAEFPQFDLGCVGEGEETLVELCERLRGRKPLEDVAGLVLRAAYGPRETPARAKIVDFTKLPHPAYDLFPRAEEYYVMSQRGCPFTCKFCMNPNGRTARQRDVEDVVAEIREIVERYHPAELSFADEIFTVNMDRAHALLDGMIRVGVPGRVRFWVQSHVNFVDEAMFRHLKRAGCFRCALGIETGDEEKLREMGKGTQLGMVKEAFAAGRRAGLDLTAFFVLGHPNETFASIRKTIALAVRLNPKLPIFGVMVPYPGTEVARLAARGEAGYKLASVDWDDFNKQLGGALEFGGLKRWQIEACQISGYLSVFVLNARFGDLARFLWQYWKSGATLVFKILRGALAPMDRPEAKAGGPAGIEESAARWERFQTSSAREARKAAAPETIKVVSRR